MEQIPEWMNNEFFTECLQNETDNKNVIVTNFSVSPAAPPGNNFGSLTTRVKVEYKSSKNDPEILEKSLIVKSEITDGAMKEVTAGLKFIEPSFYYQFIAKARNYTDTFFVPRSLNSPRSDVTILEDLKDKGFVMVDRLKKFDFDHCSLYMIAAASMHAVSAVVFKDFPQVKEIIGGEKLFGNECPGRFVTQGLIKGGMKCLAEVTEKNQRFKKYTKVIEDTTPYLWDMLVEAHKPSEVLNTLNQGDPWTTNMMFKYNDKGAVTEVKLLDFQCLRIGSPINDVMYLIWSSAENDIKKHKIEELYQIYLDTFNGKLEEFGCVERLTYEQLKAEVKKLSPLTFLFAACYQPLLCWPHTLDVSVFIPKEGEELDTKPLMKKYFNDEFCNNFLLPFLESMEKNGIFDYIQNLKK